MPTAQLVTAGIERVFNQLLKLDPDSATNMAKLRDKHLAVDITELPHTLVFAFTDQIHVLARERSETGLEVDCRITLSLTTLQKLRDTSQLTQLIKQEKLALDGDIQVAQGFSQLAKELNIDWEEQVSKYTGDVIAHTLFSLGKGFVKQAHKTATMIAETLKDGAIEEKKLAAHPFAVEDFCEQVNGIRSATERAEARIKVLEKKRESN